MMRSSFKKTLVGAAACLSLASNVTWAVENPLFGYTHLLPSPFTLPAGRFVLGTDIGVGVTDFLQVGTNLIADFTQIYNANAKLSILDFPAFALGLNMGFQSYNTHDLNNAAPNTQITSWLPGAVAGFGLVQDLAVFVGGNLNFTSQTIETDGVTKSGYFRGANVETDLSWAYNPHKKSIGNVLSGGLSYDISYQLFGVGLSHHWRGFHVGVHYYPTATQNKFLPILSGGAVVDL